MKTHQITSAAKLLMLLANTSLATTHYVDLNCTNPVSPYTNWVTAATNIQDAVNHAAPGDVVSVTNGVYQYGTYSASGNNRVFVFNNMTVQSVNGPAVTTIMGYQVPGTTNGSTAVRCVYLNDGATLSGFTLTNGATENSPGSSGGGVYCPSTTYCLVTNCVIIGNAAYNLGGGTYYGTFVNCVLSGNAVTPSASFANGGGAAYGVLINCLLTRNVAGYEGGAAEGCTLINCTVVSNISSAYSSVTANRSVTGGPFKNSIIYYNFNTYTNADIGGANAFSNCCVSFPTNGLTGVANFTNPPLFANLAGGDFHLSAASPCINSGNNSFITNATDLDGNPRIVGGIVDLGAYEFQSPVHYVMLTSINPISPYTNWLTAATNIQDAIDSASNGDSVIVADGIYRSGGRLASDTVISRIVVTNALSITSVNGPTKTMISGGNTMRCAALYNGAMLSGFTLTNGNAGGGYGGGATCGSVSILVTNCILWGNSAGAGGGAFQGTFVNCVFAGNNSPWGGAVYQSYLLNCLVTNNSNAGNMSLFNGCNLSGNQGASSPVIYYCSLTNCTIQSNSCNTYCCFRGSMANCLLVGNQGYATCGGTALYNCTVVNNSYGVWDCLSVNCVIYYNDLQGGQNFNADSVSELRPMTLYNCCTFPDPAGLYSSIGNITNEPGFRNLSNGDYHLQFDSPCVNSGNNTYIPGTTDLDGNPRIVGGTVDIGAYEYQTPTSVLSYAWAQQYGLPTDGSVDYADLDGTGFNVYQDWIAGLNPTNALSVLAMLPPAPTNNPSGLIVSWESVNNRTYFLQSSTNLGMQPAFSTIQSNIVGQAGTTSYTDTNAVGNGPFFYRVGVQQ